MFVGYGIHFLKERWYHSCLAKLCWTSYLPAPYVVPAFHKTCPTQYSNWWHGFTELASIPTQISKTDIDPNQISASDIGVYPIILSRCRSSLPWIHNQSQLTWSPTKYLQQTTGLPQSASGINHLRHQTPSIPHIFQYMPLPHTIYPTNAVSLWNIVNRHQVFQTRCCGFSGAV